ncbi:MAG TPA: Rieske 2Fe-2S domain-containing protein [Acidimicrobiales bacterium]
MTARLTQDDLTAALEWFWHPTAAVSELDAAGGLLRSRLLGRDLVVARLGGGALAVLPDRCPHRSTRLSVGCVDGAAIRCAYHGWRWDAAGRCVEIPSAPDAPIPARFQMKAFEGRERHGLVWVRLRPGAPTEIPPVPAVADPTMRVVAGAPYVWATSAPRRVENFVDLAHFAWVHDGTLGSRAEPVPPDVTVLRVGNELRFGFESPPVVDPDPAALLGASDYRMPMPLTVDISFRIAGRPGVRRHLWMTAAPLEPGVCRTYWSVARNDDLDGPDDDYLDFQQVVLAEDEAVVCNQVPAEFPLDARAELQVKADKVSFEYRRWLRELVAAARQGAAALAVAAGGAAPEVGEDALAGTRR